MSPATCCCSRRCSRARRRCARGAGGSPVLRAGHRAAARLFRRSRLSQAAFHRARVRARLDQLVGAQRRLPARRCCAPPASRSRPPPSPTSTSAASRRCLTPGTARRRSIQQRGGGPVIEAAMIWNEPNNKSHWDPALDPDWALFADHVIRAGNAIAEVNPAMTRVLGGMSPIDPLWLAAHGGARRARCGRRGRGARLSARLEPLAARRLARQDRRDQGRDRQAGVGDRGRGQLVRRRGGAGVRARAHRRTARAACVPRIFWYSLFDLPISWGAETRHREAEGSSLLPAFLPRPDPRGRHAQARARCIRASTPRTWA